MTARIMLKRATFTVSVSGEVHVMFCGHCHRRFSDVDVTLQRAKREHCTYRDFVSLKRFAGGEMEQVGEGFRGGFDSLACLHPASQFGVGAILLVGQRKENFRHIYLVASGVMISPLSYLDAGESHMSMHVDIQYLSRVILLLHTQATRQMLTPEASPK